MSFLLLNLLACASPFEGTWLFFVDREEKLTGDCADPDDTTTYTGTTNAWVDIYRLQSGEFTVLFSQPLVGTAEGSDLEASWEESYAAEDYEERSSVELEATLDGNTMSGSVTTKNTSASGEDSYSCSSKVSFSAERTVSSPDAYPEN